MRTPSVSAVKWLLPLLLFLSMGGNTSFAFSIAELKQEDSQAKETFRSSQTLTWAIRENAAPEFSDPSENNFFGSISGKDHLSLPVPIISTRNYYSEYNRDLRKYISVLTFPTHFFL